ncbi:MAG: hypothetical protein AVDCRST_MAG02-1780 [uncultured Rubrobacteraceae bacterium]|uniref:TVP38/TMEM64 family membrane protein n=1 Tax=uncultured Rubrobacteraceae bacterium TaxID=349277 RepID=A0A6J4R5M8_9ACTN|nr:MAG: hypothetical protein AVDCRST_MAG02-1780 [uncultured Rubrobacteraceae bacterium]
MRRTAREGPLEELVPGRRLLPRVLVGVGILCAVLLVLWLTGWGASLWEVFSDRERVQRAIAGAGVWAPLVYLAFLVAQAVVAPLPAPAVAIAGGYTFGVVEGFLLTWVGVLIGGVISFGISRLFGRDFVAGSARGARLDRYVEEHGLALIFVLRLIPLVSFDAISYAAGLSSIRFWSFFGATALGMLPGTFAFVYLGGSPAGFGTWAILAGLAALAIAAYIYQRRAFGLRRRVR